MRLYVDSGYLVAVKHIFLIRKIKASCRYVVVVGVVKLYPVGVSACVDLAYIQQIACRRCFFTACVYSNLALFSH